MICYTAVTVVRTPLDAGSYPEQFLTKPKEGGCNIKFTAAILSYALHFLALKKAYKIRAIFNREAADG